MLKSVKVTSISKIKLRRHVSSLAVFVITRFCQKCYQIFIISIIFIFGFKWNFLLIMLLSVWYWVFGQKRDFKTMAADLEFNTKILIDFSNFVRHFIAERITEQWSPYVQVLVVSGAAFKSVRNIWMEPPNVYGYMFQFYFNQY